MQPSRRDFLVASTAAVAGLAARKAAFAMPASDYFRCLEMVGRVTETSALVTLLTAVPLPAPIDVRLEIDDGDIWHTAPISTPQGNHRIELPAVAGAMYRVQWRETGMTQWWSFPDQHKIEPQKPAGHGFNFFCMADMHLGHDVTTPPRAAMLQDCIAMIPTFGPYDFAIDLGDSVYPTVDDETQSMVSQRYAAYRALIQPLTGGIPIYVVEGNHEYGGGYYQHGGTAPPNTPPTWIGPQHYMQKWATFCRLRFLCNPRGDTYPQGGEQGDTGSEWGAGSDPWNNWPQSGVHLQNYYAWTWGDALFVVLDPYRYTLPGQFHLPNAPEHWTLGATQMQWLEDTLAASTAPWKFVVCHQHVGGGPINIQGHAIEPNTTEPWYGRGSANDVTQGEMAAIHALLIKHRVQFWVNGHDHCFCHAVKDGVNYLTIGRPNHINPWWNKDGMLASFGNAALQGSDREWVEKLLTVSGFATFRVTPDAVTMRWYRTRRSVGENGAPDWRESFWGLPYAPATGMSVAVTLTPDEVEGVRLTAPTEIFEEPESNLYLGHDGTKVWFQEQDPPPESVFVNTLPELVYEIGFAA